MNLVIANWRHQLEEWIGPIELYGGIVGPKLAKGNWWKGVFSHHFETLSSPHLIIRLSPGIEPELAYEKHTMRELNRLRFKQRRRGDNESEREREESERESKTKYGTWKSYKNSTEPNSQWNMFSFRLYFHYRNDTAKLNTLLRWCEGRGEGANKKNITNKNRCGLWLPTFRYRAFRDR